MDFYSNRHEDKYPADLFTHFNLSGKMAKNRQGNQTLILEIPLRYLSAALTDEKIISRNMKNFTKDFVVPGIITAFKHAD